MLRRAWLPVGLAVLVLAGCSKPNPPKVLPPTIDGNTLPSAAIAALDEKWPKKGWQITSVDPQVASCLPKANPAKEVVTADFDSDGMSDIAATVLTPTGVRLVVLMARTWGYDIYDVDSLGDKVSTVSLGLEPRGKRYSNLTAGLTNNYSADAITTFVCGTTRVSYLWSGNGYYKVLVAK